MVSKESLFYDSRIQKKVPCLIKENELFEINDNFGVQYYIHVSFDDTKYTNYNTNRDELMRYSSEFIKLNDIYPAETQAEIDYAVSVMPKQYANTSVPHLTTSTHNTDELDRFEKIINILTDTTGDISSAVFIKLFNFIMYELYFTYCNATERAFLDSLSASQLGSQPGTIYVPQILRTLKQLFSKFDYGAMNMWKILNFKHFSEFENNVPILVSLVNLDFNVNFITGL